MMPDHVVITRVKSLSEPVLGISADTLKELTQSKLDAMRERHFEAFPEWQHANNVALNPKSRP